MNRYTFLKPKSDFNPGLVLGFIVENPGLTPIQITRNINRDYGFNKSLPQVFAIIAALKRQRRVKAKRNKAGELTYEAS